MSNRPVTLAQIGIGYWGKNLLRNFSQLEDVHVKYICDVRDTVKQQFGSLYPDSVAVHDYDQVLNDDSVEGVVISTETPLHFPMAKQALLAGKHVFVEKPMTQTPEEAEELVRIAEDKDLRLMVGHLLLYHPAFCYLENAIKGNVLGEVYYMHSTRVNLGIIRQKENAFESLAPHDLAVALRYMDTQPVGISATGQSYLQPQIEDIVFATVFFDGGKLAHLHTSWLDPLKVRKLTVVGSSKMAVVDDMQPEQKITLYDKGVDLKPGEERYIEYGPAMTVRSGPVEQPELEDKEPLRAECEHFIECIRLGTRPKTDGASGLQVVQLLDAAQRSLASNGKRIDL